MSLLESYKRRRVATACEHCRKRKVKCDGESPCTSCESSGLNCVYVPTEKKRAPQSASEAASSRSRMRELQTRIHKMEDLIEHLVTKLDSNSVEGIIKDLEQDERRPEDMDSDEFSPEKLLRKSLLNKGLSLDALGDEEYAVQGGFDPNRADLSVSDSSMFVKHNIEGSKRIFEVHFGPQSALSLFSPRGLRWVQSKLGKDSGLIFPLKELHVYVIMIAKYNWSKWRDPISKSQLTALPDKNVTTLLMEFFFKTVDPFMFLEVSEVQEIVELYYENLKLPASEVHNNLSYGDMLIINCVLVFSISVKRDLDRQTTATQGPGGEGSIPSPLSPLPSLSQQIDMTDDQLFALQEKLYHNTIYYYYKICLGGNGIRGVQAILLLLTYLERTLSMQAHTILTSTLIRFAQEIGLHRSESFYGLQEKEIERRKKIWWCCYNVDKHSCMRRGRPLLIRDDDVSTSFPKEFVSIYENRMTKTIPAIMNGVDPVLFNIAKQQGFGIYFHFYTTQLSQITSRGYEKLFLASALKGKSVEQIAELIHSLNNELLVFRESIDFPIRPGTEIDLTPYEDIVVGFPTYNKFHEVISLHLNYYFHLMIFNRVLFKSAFESGYPERVGLSHTCSQVCLDSARQIVKLSLILDETHYNFVNWSYCYAFNAFVTLFCACVEYPQSGYARSDVDLLMDLVKRYFGKPRPSENCINLKWEATDLLHRQLIKIAIKVIENKGGTEVKNKVGETNYSEVRAYEEGIDAATGMTAPVSSNQVEFQDIGEDVLPPETINSFYDFFSMIDTANFSRREHWFDQHSINDTTDKEHSNLAQSLPLQQLQTPMIQGNITNYIYSVPQPNGVYFPQPGFNMPQFPGQGINMGQVAMTQYFGGPNNPANPQNSQNMGNWW